MRAEYVNLPGPSGRRIGFTAAGLLSQLCYLSERNADVAGWFEAGCAELTAQTGISRHEQLRGLEVLVGAGYIHVDRRRNNSRWVRVQHAAISEVGCPENGHRVSGKRTPYPESGHPIRKADTPPIDGAADFEMEAPLEVSGKRTPYPESGHLCTAEGVRKADTTVSGKRTPLPARDSSPFGGESTPPLGGGMPAPTPAHEEPLPSPAAAPAAPEPEPPAKPKRRAAPTAEPFVAPSVEQLETEFATLLARKSLPATCARPLAEGMYGHYDANGWRVGRNPMKRWQSACLSWLTKELQWHPARFARDGPIQRQAVVGAARSSYDEEREAVQRIMAEEMAANKRRQAELGERGR